MAGPSNIEWTDRTVNAIRARRTDGSGQTGWHCVHASEGCRHCYSEGMNRRYNADRQKGIGTGYPFKPDVLERGLIELFLDDDVLRAPLRWRRPCKIFPCSMTDLFADFVPLGFIDAHFAMFALTGRHIYQVLTKRSSRLRTYTTDPKANGRVRALAHAMAEEADVMIGGIPDQWPLPNVWCGVSVEDQQRATERVPDLVSAAAAVRFLSCEPLLGQLDLVMAGAMAPPDLPFFQKGTPLCTDRMCDRAGPHYPLEFGCRWGNAPNGPPGIDWVIAGGESGQKARPMHPDWVRSMRDQCAAAGVPFFFKQWGAWQSIYDRQAEDPDWRKCADVEYRTRDSGQWLNLAGGMGFHGESVHRMKRATKASSGRALDGRTHDAFPMAPHA